MNTIEAPARLPKVLTSTRQRLAIVAAVLLLAAATFLANRVLPGWAYPLCGATAAGLLIALAWWARLSPSAIGLDPRHLRRALLVGLAGLGLVGLGFGIALVVPALRSMFMDARVGSPGFTQLLWLALIRIPLGTVLIEEIAAWAQQSRSFEAVFSLRVAARANACGLQLRTPLSARA